MILAYLEKNPESVFSAHSYSLLGKAYEALDEPQLAADSYLKAVKLDLANRELDAHDALFRLSLNRDLSIPQPELQSTIEVDESCDLVLTSGSVFQFRVRIFQGIDCKILLTNQIKPPQITSVTEKAEQIGNLVKEKYNLDLENIVWFDYSIFFGRPSLSQIRVCTNSDGFAVECLFEHTEMKRFEKLTGFRINWNDI